MFYRDYTSVRGSIVLSVAVGTLIGATGALAAAEQVGPASVAAGPFAITPTLGAETKYRDNIYLQERDETDSWIYTVRPAVDAVVQDRENIYKLSYQGEAAWYDESSSDDDNDYFDNTFSGSAHMELRNRWEVEGEVSWASLHEDRGTGLTEGVVGNAVSEPVEYDQTDVGGSVQYGLDEGISRILVSAGYMDREYQNFRDFTRSRDREETGLGLVFFHTIAPKTDALVEYAYLDIEYPNPFDNAPKLDSVENSLWLGAEWEITPHLTSTAKVGYVDKDFDASERKDWDGVGVSADLWMQPRDHDTIFVQAKREPEETTLQGDFIVREELLAEWTHDWSDRIYTKLSGSIGRDEYKESVNDREDDIYNVSLTFGYEFRRWAEIYAGYSYDDKDSNADDLSYSDNVFLLGVDLSL